MKTYLKLLTLFTTFMCIGIQPISAKSNTDLVYFKTNTGVELSKQQFNNLSKGFDFNTLNNLSPKMINYLKNNKDLKKVSAVKYIKSEFIYNQRNLISKKETEITEDEYNNSEAEIKIEEVGEPLLIMPLYSGIVNDYIHQTTYKRIEIYWTAGWSQDRIITLKNTWRQLPLYRSFDVMALAPQNLSWTLTLNDKSGYQLYDGNIINYSSGSANFKIPSAFGILKKGVGLSQNLVDSASNSIENSMTVHFYSNEMPFYVRGSYQHATSNVTLSQSQNYSLSTSGMGGLILFDGSVDQYYDDTQGVICKIDSLTDTSCS